MFITQYKNTIIGSLKCFQQFLFGCFVLEDITCVVNVMCSGMMLTSGNGSMVICNEM